MIITTLHNNSKHVLVVREGQVGLLRKVREIQPGGRHKFRCNLTATYLEYWLAWKGLYNGCILTSDDLIDWREIEIRSPENDVTKVIWKGLKITGSQSVSHLAEEDDAFYLAAREDAFYLAAREDASERIETVARFSVDLEELLKRVIISLAQCKYLVQFCSIRIQKIKGIFSGVSVYQMRRLYESKKLRQLSISLDNLLRALLSTRILLKGCGGKEWRKAALVLSLPPPDNQLEKYSGSRFALLIRELGWSFDMVQYALGDGGTKDLIFEWRDEGGRYVLQGNLLQNGVAIDEMESLQEDNDRETLDRQHLLTYLENSSILKDNVFSPLAWRRFWYTFPRGKFAAAVQNRCQDRCFEIDYLDFKKKKRISKGAFKKIHKGEWLGLEVAIATIWNVPKEDVEREAGFMVTVHHPNVVDFFGCAFKKEDDSAQENPWTAFLVMELMEEDLGRLIARVTTDPLVVRRPDSGSPFSLSVTVDILIQIVEAMIHSHKHKVMHRDLKTNNCLVSKKSAPQSDVDAYYRVKVIDFGLSTFWNSERDIHTARRGTVRFMAPEVWNGGDYTCSADVYSFGMVCYEVITGSPPFNHLLKNEDVLNLVRTGERPPIPGTCPQSLNSLMTKCWAPEPSLRPTFEAIRKELWDFKLLIELQIHA